MTINTNEEYQVMSPIWSYMRDAWAGQSHIRCIAQSKGYYKPRTNFNNSMNERYMRSGRYPNLVNVIVNQGVNRILSREPENMEKLCKHVKNPEKFLSWLLKQLALVGGAGISLDLSHHDPKFVTYNVESIPNWSNNSIAFIDDIPIKNKYGFVEGNDIGHVILWNNGSQTVHTTLIKDLESGNLLEEDHELEWGHRTIDFIPACRISTEDKPLFMGLAESCMDYFLTTAMRNYILHQMVPQPILTLPDEDKISEAQLKQFLDDKTIEYGVGTLIVLPNGASFKFESPVVRSLGEMRQELVLIKDEMISQGVNAHMQRGGQIGNMNSDTVRLHMNEQVLSFYDIIRQAEWAINKLLCQVEYLQFGDRNVLEYGFKDPNKQFKFKTVDFSDNDIEDTIDNIVRVSENPRTSEKDSKALIDGIIEELSQRGMFPDE